MIDRPPETGSDAFPDILAASLGRRYSGVNASMLAVIPAQRLQGQRIAGVGFHLPPEIPAIRFSALRKLADGRPRVWHARRNSDMLAGILLGLVPGVRLKLLFTSAALRHHSWITRWYCRKMDALIATTDRAASFLNREATVIRHGVDTDRFRPSPMRGDEWRSLGAGGERGIAVFGRIRPNKGSEDFLEALRKVLPKRPGWNAAFVGEATEAYRGFVALLRYRLEADGLESRVRFTGFVSQADLPRWYRAASVVVCPSREEGFGLPCLEAFASGTPVVATGAGAWPELVEPDGTGKLVGIEDPAALARALLDLTADPDRLERMGRTARERALARFSIQEEARAIGAVYRRLLGGAA